MERIVALWRKHREEEVDDTRLADVRYSECVSFSCDARVPRASLYRRKPRRAKRVVDSSSTPGARRPLQSKDATYEWVDYSAPLVCLEEEEDGVCLREEPTPCSDDPNSLVCSIDTRQLPQKRKRNPWVSVCIDDMGVDYYMSRRAVRLRPAVTLSYLPYGLEVREQARAATAAGHELMVHLPMEPFNKAADAGPNALHSSMTQDQLRQHLHWALSQFDGYVGLNNHMGSLFTSRFHDGMRVVLEELRRRDLFFLDSLTANDSLGQELAAHLGTTFGARDVFLDSQRDDVAAVEERLAEVEQLALKNGHAIAIGHPYPATLEALERWLPMLNAKGLRLMPLKKALLRERKERERMAGEAMLAFTRSKQLRVVQAVRERKSRERHARAVASELEAAFGDGTVLGWRGLQDAAAVQALRLVLEKRRQAPSGLRASLQRLLLTPFQGGRGTRGPHVEKAAVRLLRRRGTAGRLADLVAPQTGAQAVQAVGRPRRQEVGVRKLSAGSNRRRVQWWNRGEPRGLVGLLEEGEGQGVSEEAQPQKQGPRGEKEAELREEGASAVAAESGPLPWSKTGKDGNGRRRKARMGQKVLARQIPEWVDSGVQDAWVEKQSGHGTGGGQKLSLGVSDQTHGMRVSVSLAGEGALQARSEGQGSKQDGDDVSPENEVRGKHSSWRHGAGSTLAMRRWLAGSTAKDLSLDNDSPRTVLATEQFEAAADASSQEDSPVGSAALSLSSESSELAAEAAASDEAWSPERSNSRSSSRRSLGSVSEGSSVEVGRQAEEQGGNAACRLVVTAATGLAVALQLSMLASKGAPRAMPEAQTTATTAPVPLGENVVLGHPPSGTDALAAAPEEAAGSPDEVLIAAEVPETAPAASAASLTPVKESQEDTAANPTVEVPAHVASSQQEVVPSDDALKRSACILAEPADLKSGGEGEDEETAPASSPTIAEVAPSLAVSPPCSPAHPSCSAPAGLQVVDREEREAFTGTALERPSVGVWPTEKKARDAPAGLLALVQANDEEGHRSRPLVPWQRAVSPTRGTKSQLGRALEVAASMEEGFGARGSEQQRAGAEEAERGAGVVLPLHEAEVGVEAGVHEGVDAHAEAGPQVDSAQRASSLPRDIPSSPTPRANPDADLLWWDAEASSLASARSSPASWGEPRMAVLGQTPQGLVAQTAGVGKLGAGPKAGHVGAAEDAFLSGQKGNGSKKKYGWWRWTVGCVLGELDEAGGEDVSKGRAVGNRGSRRVVPLNFDDEEVG